MTAPLSARARRWLLAVTNGPPGGAADEYIDIPRGIVGEVVAAGLAAEFTGPGHERGRYAGVLLTDAAYDRAAHLRREARAALQPLRDGR